MEEGKRRRRTQRMTLFEVSRGPRRTRSADYEDWPPSPRHALRDFDDLRDDLRPRGPTETQTWPVCWAETHNLFLCAVDWIQANRWNTFCNVMDITCGCSHCILRNNPDNLPWCNCFTGNKGLITEALFGWRLFISSLTPLDIHCHASPKCPVLIKPNKSLSRTS